ncbi:MAG: aminotransferase class I/II-fold pyridoxal phosphate-dependent enzyme [Bacteroidetes bacterium]|nr:MAG: aminotransferase class I/II-fold pyridoxal phosphate-dependent enzyme [Bacteroidota bacterium]
MHVNHMASGLAGSQILALAEEIKARLRAGHQVYNLTIGDFDPQLFPIPGPLREAIAAAYAAGETQYPASNGMPELRAAAAAYTRRRQGLDYSPEAFLVASGARPLIFAAYLTLINPGEKVIYPVPSWNNNFYTHIAQGSHVALATDPADNFLPTPEQVAPHLQEAGLLALCSPLNPAGTVFERNQLAGICELVLAENARRGPDAKPLYVLFDQIYGALTYGDTVHVDPVSLFPEMQPYTLYIDGMSKAFAATGVRVGWAFGPDGVIAKMRSLLAHAGAWAARPEQLASAAFLDDLQAVDTYLSGIREGLSRRLEAFFTGLQQMETQGLPVDVIPPQAALYLTVKIDLAGYRTPNGSLLQNGRDIYSYLLHEASVALVPFYAFGLPDDSPWFRLSVGTVAEAEIPGILARMQAALEKLGR